MTQKRPTPEKRTMYTEEELALRRKRRRIQQLKRRRRKLIIKMVLVLLILILIPVFIIKSKNKKEIEQANELLNNYYTSFVENQELPKESTSETDFSVWFTEKYLDGKVKNILSYTEDDKLTKSIYFPFSTFWLSC